MNPEVQLLFQELADLSATERKRILGERYIAPDIRAEVESLLSFDGSEDEQFSNCVAAYADEMQREATASEPATCGPYRLVRLLGTGGTSAVYLGERMDGEIQRNVAVKILRDGDRPAWRERFLKERQLLASLNHPSIAQMFDAGHDIHGRPYLVMEYVDGLPIDSFAAELPLRQKLDLFLQICVAVAYAHQHLIIHRDLKPSNILVDASGRPKLLDFGIAKLMDQVGDSTRTVERLLTPSYASPEQVRGTPQTTATDVYSLGAILYKLLTGNSPREADGEASSFPIDSGNFEVPAPSRLNSSLPKDLDYVAAKALRNEANERYASVEAFANDIHAFLESKPVQARSGNIAYRTRKFARRYWAPVLATLVTTTALAAALLAANYERSIAQRRFLQVRQLANKVLALDDVLKGLPGSTKARHEIVDMSKNYLEALGTEAGADPELALDIGAAYGILAKAQGVPGRSNLGQYAQAAESLRKGDALVESVLSASPRNRKALLASAEIAGDRMILADSDHLRDEESAQANKAAQRLDALLALGNASRDEMTSAAVVFGNIALANKNMHRYEESIHAARRSIAASETLPDRANYESQGLSIIADCMRLSGDLDGALAAIRQAHSILEKIDFPTEVGRQTTRFNVLWREGIILGGDDTFNVGQFDEAIAVFQDALDGVEALAQKDRNDAASRILVATAARELGRIFGHNPRPDNLRRAMNVFDLGLTRIREVGNNSKARREEVRLLTGSSYVLRKLNRPAEAQSRIDTAFQILKETKDYPADKVDPDEEAAVTLRALGDHLRDRGQSRQALNVYRELLDKVMSFHPDPENDLRHALQLSLIYAALSDLYRQSGDLEKASGLSALRSSIWRTWYSKLPKNAYIRSELDIAK
jgi:tetratricopeptide (TPR) repeat protein